MKEKILIATLELACEKGLGNVSMSQIASKCGLSKSSLYSHYKSKEDIINKMYEFFREKSYERSNTIDITSFNENSSFYDILISVVESYKHLNNDKYLYKFYKMIYSERTINKEAAKILVLETKKMINATKQLFNYTNSIGVSNIKDVDTVSMSFALNVNQIINYEIDLEFIGEDSDNNIDLFIKEFSRVYGVK